MDMQWPLHLSLALEMPELEKLLSELRSEENIPDRRWKIKCACEAIQLKKDRLWRSDGEH